MSDLEKTLAQPTMSSIELLALINQARAAFNEPEVRRNQFNARVEDELEGTHYKKTVVTNENGTESIVFELTQDQCMLVSMRESKAVRRWVLVSIHARHCWRANQSQQRHQSRQSRFNPRPPLLAGESSAPIQYRLGLSVSIHARHSWRANRSAPALFWAKGWNLAIAARCRLIFCWTWGSGYE